MVAPRRHRPGRLDPGARIAVIGGGPAGSSFALFALHLARQAGLDLRVTVFEPRDFSQPGPRGCNMCAGLIPLNALEPLAEIGVTVPDGVIRAWIDHYTLHTAAGAIRLARPSPEGRVISVYRGSGPRDGPPLPHDVSFDGFMLATARARGAEVVPEMVTAVTHEQDHERHVLTAEGRYGADLVVLASGVNRSRIAFDDVDFRPPTRQQMAQSELLLGADGVRDALGGSVHVVLAGFEGLTFGTLIPKGPYVNVSLLGTDLPSDAIARFLALPEVTAVIPAHATLACSCRPRIAVGPARPLFADRFVAIGDAGVTRLYKNGIGSAIHTAREAARTALLHGVAAEDFGRHYGPLGREIERDNRAGRFLFAFSRIFRQYRGLTLPHLHSVASERSRAERERHHSRFLWAMFTGAYPYRRLVWMALHPRIHLRLLGGAIRGVLAARGGVTRSTTVEGDGARRPEP
jgi:flavin-dependent dehydrogenase